MEILKYKWQEGEAVWSETLKKWGSFRKFYSSLQLWTFSRVNIAVFFSLLFVCVGKTWYNCVFKNDWREILPFANIGSSCHSLLQPVHTWTNQANTGGLKSNKNKVIPQCVDVASTWECWAGSRAWRWAPPCWSDPNWEGCWGSDHCAGLSPLKDAKSQTGKHPITEQTFVVLHLGKWYNHYVRPPDRKASFFLSTGRMVLASMLTLDICRWKRQMFFFMISFNKMFSFCLFLKDLKS